MKKILIYGDSNTWGDNFFLGKRIDDDKQWANILQRKLGSEYKVIQEGLPGRIAGNFDIEEPYKNGKDSFLSIYKSQAPIDILIIALGSNDLQIKYNKDYKDIIKDLLWYKEALIEDNSNLLYKNKYYNKGELPKIIYIMPVNFKHGLTQPLFNKNSEEKREKIIKYFNSHNYDIISLNCVPLFKDGLHMNYEGHEMMSEEVFKKIINYR